MRHHSAPGTEHVFGCLLMIILFVAVAVAIASCHDDERDTNPKRRWEHTLPL